MGWFDDPKDKPKRKRKTIPKSVKIQVWDKYIGATLVEGKCYACKARTIHRDDFEAGHNKAKAKGGGDNVANLRPICRQCNTSMGTMSIETYRARYFGKAKTEGKKAQAHPTNIVGRLQSYVLKQGYELSSKKYGFDVCAKKGGGLLGTDKYLVVDEMQTVTDKGIAAFMKKTGEFSKTISAKYMLDTPVVEGLIAHTGKLPEGSKALVKGFKPAIMFKKF